MKKNGILQAKKNSHNKIIFCNVANAGNTNLEVNSYL